MPFTLAHPAAAVPLRRLLGARAALSALVIGSMVPDFWYFMPFGVTRGDTHGVAGLFWFCLPVGLAVYALYHGLVQEPVRELLPESIARRLTPHARGTPVYAPWLSVLASLLVGALTHLAWDWATHDGSPIEEAVPALDDVLFTVGAYPVHGYSLLQHGSSLVGMALLGWWLYRWYRRAPLGPAKPRRFSAGGRRAVVISLVVSAAAIGAAAMIAAWQQGGDVVQMRAMAKLAFGRVGALLGLALVAYGAGWHLLGLASRRG